MFQYQPAVLDALATAYQQAAPDTPVNLESLRHALDAYQTLFTTIADGIRQADRLSEPKQRQFARERTYTRDEWFDQLPTHGRLNLLPPCDWDAIRRTGRGDGRTQPARGSR
nr:MULTISPECIES: hypothetical protein [Pseudofrankia]